MKKIIALLLAFVGVANAENSIPLKDLDVGGYSEIVARPNPQHLTIQFIPALVAILLSTEQKKGSPLTQKEVELIRDKSTVMVSSSEAAQAVENQRGYKDINPLHCWEEWQVLRVQLKQ